MPSPFPGMDPYLEHPLLWPSVQQHFLTLLADTLRDVLPPHYQVQICDRVFVEVGDSLAAPLLQQAASCPREASSNSAAPRQRPDGIHPCWHIASTPEEVRESSVEITPAGEPDRVLTSVEFLTVLDKTSAANARRLYRQRQLELLQRGAHLLEFDLLRWGEHCVVAPRERILRRGRCDYLVSLCRAGAREFCEVWGIPLRERLPRVALPLAGDDEDLLLDVQRLFDQCYDIGNFAQRIDYTEDPFFALSPSAWQWARTALLRPAVADRVAKPQAATRQEETP